MKKNYQKPTMNVVEIQHQSIICNSLTRVGGNADLNYVGGGTGEAHSRSFDGWDDDE